MFLWRKSVSHLFQSIVYAKDQINPIRSWVATPNAEIDDLACELCTQCVPYPRCTCRRPSCCCPPGSWASPSSLPRLSPNFFRWVSWVWKLSVSKIFTEKFLHYPFLDVPWCMPVIGQCSEILVSDWLRFQLTQNYLKIPLMIRYLIIDRVIISWEIFWYIRCKYLIKCS